MIPGFHADISAFDTNNRYHVPWILDKAFIFKNKDTLRTRLLRKI